MPVGLSWWVNFASDQMHEVIGGMRVPLCALELAGPSFDVLLDRAHVRRDLLLREQGRSDRSPRCVWRASEPPFHLERSGISFWIWDWKSRVFSHRASASSRRPIAPGVRASFNRYVKLPSTGVNSARDIPSPTHAIDRNSSMRGGPSSRGIWV